MIRGRYRYAARLMVDYFKTELPHVWPCTKIPKDRQAPPCSGRPVVLISSVQAGGPPVGPHGSNLVLAWRRLIFQVIGDDEEQAADVCEEVRSAVVRARYAHVIRGTSILGEPGRLDVPDEPVPRFQTTIDVLLREHYPRRAATVTT